MVSSQKNQAIIIEQAHNAFKLNSAQERARKAMLQASMNPRLALKHSLYGQQWVRKLNSLLSQSHALVKT
jgi:hypothetical protein